MNIVDKRKTTKFCELKVGDVFKGGEVIAICVSDENNKGNIGINLATGTKLSLTSTASVEILETTLTIENGKKEETIEIEKDIKDITLGEISTYCVHSEDCTHCPISRFRMCAEDIFVTLYDYIQQNK